jgi:anhydro-N-acetylmuramic acid kinase
MRVLGIMSGTSMDGVDYAICEFNREGRVAFVEHWDCPFPKKLRERLRSAASNVCSSYETAQLHHDLGRFYASGTKRKNPRLDLAGLHGQTIFHNPRQPSSATLQIGEPAYLREALGVPVISNFRAADLTAGGQGAPLATMFHLQVFGRKGKHVAVNNIGGISNVTSLNLRKNSQPKILAFDTGPGNMLIDIAARHFSNGKNHFDRDGSLSSRGKINERLLSEWLRHSYFLKTPPKSTGRELFGEVFFQHAVASELKSVDLMATLTELTARTIALNYSRHLPSLPDEVILCGGGARNPYLYARIALALRELKSEIAISSSAEHGWEPQVIEAAAFALLAWLAFNRKPGNLPETTGARGPRLLGQITL